MRTHEHTITDFIVRFDNRATHRCKSLDEARQFAREAANTAVYGTPTAIERHTRHITSTYENVYEFGWNE